MTSLCLWPGEEQGRLQGQPLGVSLTRHLPGAGAPLPARPHPERCGCRSGRPPAVPRRLRASVARRGAGSTSKHPLGGKSPGTLAGRRCPPGPAKLPRGRAAGLRPALDRRGAPRPCPRPGRAGRRGGSGCGPAVPLRGGGQAGGPGPGAVLRKAGLGLELGPFPPSLLRTKAAARWGMAVGGG